MLTSIRNNLEKAATSQEQIKYINFFFLGILGYSFGSGMMDTQIIHPVICNLIQLIGIGMIFISFIFLIDFSIENLYLKIIYYSYLFYLASIVLRGFAFDYNYIKSALFSQYFGVLLYAVPLVMLIPINFEFLKRLRTAIQLFAVLHLFFLVLNVTSIINVSHYSLIITESLSRTFGITAGFLLLTFPFHSKKTIALALTSMISILLLAVYQGRRGLSIFCFMILAFAAIIYLTKGKNIAIVLVISSMAFASLMFFGMEKLTNNGLFSTLKSRGLADTRSNVEANFYEDMQPIDWIIGRGINGEYYCPGIIWGDGEPSVYRSIIETDYLQIILKGGIISLGLLLLILIPAGLIGILRSRNLFSMAAGLWILIGVINMYPSPINTFTFNYLLIWICVRICFSPRIRNLSNKEIMILLKTHNIKLSSQSKSL
ncbi:hypothetical protein ACFSKL_13320 [Belliella marina]|uniref:O-antigen ligase n=1 Tax=Belliella marina TaxID=1644146 RepID=A0ABW4VM62_9BACT